ncbi:CDP-diacylglycerol-inositol 3-phosphatidyltransferase [Gymnopus androsaceus JB14]|uniref:CDP-diacylglycerol--inositol 3-phosphatidyltransferase n=1 Tax=Gymnopus androsaceus JB14 TaxID=1447944 RepID=A0A6A4HMM8_9AGAR|nr:CDP-diacylglycerol-inositol 3-phosphatidyltransferase [Gymnopus androsaceus JB14]
MSSPSQTSRRRKRPQSVSHVDAKEAVDLATAQSENVFLFVPNLIGYTRIILAAFSLHFMSYHPIYCTVTYSVSCLLDAVDGKVARARGETSKFGAVLDMVTDRCTTSCLLCYLAIAYPTWAILFQFLIALDFSSHYMHMYSSVATGSASHKKVTSDVSRILWLYYNDARTLFLVCAGNELFFVALYVAKWTSTPVPVDLSWVPYFGHLLATLTYAEAVAGLSAPVCILKNIINVVQLWKASKILVGVDLAERAEARKKKIMEEKE